ncbi:MAG: hypothetical protein KGZ94_05980 [Clostridia bacterium]|nr:hypothetical protein [Clostridia bacterium]
MSVFAHIDSPIAQEAKPKLHQHEPSQEPAQEQEARIYIDPRQDLEADSVLWTKLLRRAGKLDLMLAGTLHGFRCGGLRIKRGRTGYLLRPDFDPIGNLAIWKDQEEYEHDKLMHLFQYRAEIKELMSSM